MASEFIIKNGYFSQGNSNITGSLNVTQGITGSALLITGSTTTDLVRITQTGTGAAFVVEDSTNPDATPFTIDGTGRVGIGLYTSSPYWSSASLQILTSGSAPGTATALRIRESASNSQFNLTAFSSSAAGKHLRISSDTTGRALAIFADSGNVGIGSTSPNATLDVSGSAIITGSLNVTQGITGSGLQITGSTTTDLVRITQTGTGNAFVVEDSTNPDSTPFVINASGSVGIGTTSPSASLTVVTNTSPSYPATSSTTQTGYYSRLRNIASNLVLDMGGNADFGNWLQSTNQTNLSLTFPLLLNPNGGNVGIGTTTPNARLDVSGSVIIIGSLTVSGSSTFTNIGPANFTGSLGVTGSTNLIGSLTISGSTTDKVELLLPLTSSQNISSSLDIIARTGSFDYIIDRGDAVIDGDLVVNGALTLAGGLQFGSSFASASLIANTDNLLIDNLASSILVRLTSAGNFQLTGIVVPDNTKTYFFNIFNVGISGNIIFKNDNAGSTAQNRFLLGGDITVQPGEGLSFIYDPADLRWRSPGKNI